MQRKRYLRGRIAEPAQHSFRRAVFRYVSYGGRCHRFSSFNGGREESRVKAQYVAAVSAGPFREEQDGKRRPQSFRNPLSHGERARSARPVDKKRSAGTGHHSKHRPLTDFGLGHHAAGQRCCVNHDVEIAKVVRHKQTAGGRAAGDQGSDSQTPHHKPRGRLKPEGAALESKRTPQVCKPQAENAHRKCKDQRHSAPDPSKVHGVSGARNRLRAADNSIFKSSRVRKSIVPNSRSHAGGAQIRAPMVR